MLKPPQNAGDRNCHLASSDTLGPLENEKSRRVRTPFWDRTRRLIL